MEEKINNKKVQLGYDASQTSYKRQNRTIDLASEDDVANRTERRKLTSDSRDLERNFPAAAFAINKHLDYCSTFNFQSKTGEDELDRDIEALIRWWSLPANCDVAGRHSLSQLTRIWEHGRTVDGDILINKVSNGRLQTIESDKIHNATNPNSNGKLFGKPEEYIHGVRVNKNLRALSYVVSERIRGSGSWYEFKAELPAEFVYHLGYFKRYDQVRGVSPIACAINSYQDVQESIELHLAKMKVAQYFGLKVTRDSTEALDNDEDAKSDPYNFDFGKGPILLDLDAGDDAQFLESKVGLETQFNTFLQSMIQLCLKSLDIPYSFYAENYTNYSGSRQALLQYELSAKNKRDQLITMLDNLTAWRLSLFIADGVLKLPKGMTVSNLKFDWIPYGLPWIDPAKEVKAQVAAIDANIMSRQQVAKQQGKDWFEIMEQLKQEQKVIQEMIGDTKND